MYKWCKRIIDKAEEDATTKPRAGESRNQFVRRCMIDDTSMSEYPDTQQRYAVCLSISAKKVNTNKTEQKKSIY